MTHARKVGTVILALATVAVALVVSSGSASAATTTVPVGDLYYCAPSFEGGVCTTTISAGDTVVWDLSGANIAHTVTDCGASCDNPTSSSVFDSGILEGGSFQFTFANAGTFNYYCQVHAFEMRGVISVQAAAAPTATLVPGTTPTGSTPVPGATPGTGSTAGGGLPPTGYGAQQGTSSQWWGFTTLALLVFGLTSFTAAAYARRRR